MSWWLLAAAILLAAGTFYACMLSAAPGGFRFLRIWPMALIAAAVLCVLVWAFPAAAHDGYEKWRDRKGYGCCDQTDCRPARAYPGEDGLWRVLTNGREYTVPADAVLSIPSPDGRSHVCIAPGAIEPRCFVPGEIRG